MTDTDLLHTLLPSRDRSSSSPANPNERPEIHKKPSYTSLQDRLTVHDVRTPDTPTTTKKHHRNSLSGSFRLRKHISSENLEDGDKRRSLPPASNSTTHLDTHVLDTVPATETLLGGCSPASEKANRDFHTLFRSVPSTDRLVDIYKCAIHKDILNQGHLYVSEHHVCFKSNIFGWVTTLVLAFTEITAIEKRMTARIIPNGLTISTVGADHVFASLLFRDETYELLIKLWKLHQSPAEVARSLVSEKATSATSFLYNLLPPSTPLPGPLRNPTTTATPLPHTCTCTTKRDPYPMVALDHTFAGTVETMYRILFDSDFMKNYLEKKENQKDVKMGQWIHGRRDNVYKLSSGVQCSSSNQILHRHMPTHVAVATSTRTPQASVGSIFVIKSRTCIRQVDPLQVHVKVTFKTKFIPSGLVSCKYYFTSHLTCCC
ncbi:GRAM domain-containing protein [Phycomyces blakesleeanus]|uniref:GRAM domain-containing protein n=1 Tax=Phycomyces blakesleeanus TaxID=4837 RepID=A0ABR3AZ21_PHYBL